MHKINPAALFALLSSNTAQFRTAKSYIGECVQAFEEFEVEHDGECLRIGFGEDGNLTEISIDPSGQINAV